MFEDYFTEPTTTVDTLEPYWLNLDTRWGDARQGTVEDVCITAPDSIEKKHTDEPIDTVVKYLGDLIYWWNSELKKVEIYRFGAHFIDFSPVLERVDREVNE